MQEFKPKLIKLVISIAYTIGGTAMSLIFAFIFFNFAIAVVVSAGITALLYYFMVITSNINLTVDREKLCVYRGKTLYKHYSLQDCSFSARLSAKSGKTDYLLKVEYMKDGNSKTERIDCSQLSRQGFYDLLNALGVERH